MQSRFSRFHGFDQAQQAACRGSAQKKSGLFGPIFQDLFALGGIFLGGAGNGVLLVGHHGLDQLHGTAQS